MDFKLSEEQQMWRDTVHRFVEKEVKPRAAELSEAQELNWSAIRKMGQLGLLGLNIPEEYGGNGLDAISAAIAIEELGWGDGGTALVIAAHTGLGCWPIVKFIITLVRTPPFTGSHSMSMIIVPTQSKGLIIAPPENKMGLGTCHSYAINFDNVHVPKENLLGEEGMGLRQTLQTLDGGRISIGAISVGIAQSAMEEAIRYAKQRQAFGHTITQFQAIQWMIADAGTEIYASRLMIYHAAWLKNKGKPYTKEGAMAKLFATEMAERVTRNAIQIHGGYGYSKEFPVERMYRDARLMTIGEGTSEVQRLVIARKLLKEFD